MPTATPARLLPAPYWVNEWITNPNDRKSLRFIADTTKDQVEELALIIPDITVPWNQVPLISKDTNGENEVGLDGPMVGAVVGAVQSGKTASMVGLISHLFDKGYDAVVVLTGTKNDLNLQTAIRLKNDVFDFGQNVLDPSTFNPLYCTSPYGEGPHKGIDQNRDFYSSPVQLGDGVEWNGWEGSMKQALRNHKPSLCVSKKHIAKAIPSMIRTMNRLNYYCTSNKQRELRWAVIDDESDQVTVSGRSDAATPGELAAVASIGECVYISYSATPQANLFAEPEEGNPLFPKHFCFMLRAAQYGENPDPNLPLSAPHPEVSYPVTHLNGLYCGGWVFHNWCDANDIADFFHSDVPLEVAFKPEDMKQPLAHYLVTGAIRWIMQGQPDFFTTPQSIGTTFPDPHSMLINPATTTNVHWKYASMIMNIVRESAGLVPYQVTERKWKVVRGQTKSEAEKYWDATKTHIPTFVTSELDLFQEVYDEVLQSHADVENIRSRGGAGTVPPFGEVIDAIEAISPNISLRVLNGNTKDRLRYDIEPALDSPNVKIPADVYTIAIGGNNLGRGITLSGLCTTVFLTNGGADDTDVQKQRWFGYRGPHLEFVKVFCPTLVWQSNSPSTLEGFREKNENLMKLYELIVENWNNQIPPDLSDPAWSIAVGQASLFSRKIRPSLRRLPQHSHTPIISWVANTALVIAKNTAAVDALYSKMQQKGMSSTRFTHDRYPISRQPLGIMCGTPYDGITGISDPAKANGDRFTLLEVADFVDSLSWEGHNPDTTPHPYRINPADMPVSIGSINLYRQPASGISTGNKIPITTDPYSIAAYLRLWHFLDLDNKKTAGTWPVSDAPAFNVIFREGTSLTKWRFPDGEEIKLRKYGSPITHTGQLTNYEWGSMNKTKLFGSNKHNDDIRTVNWPEDDKWRSKRSRVRANNLPGMLQIRFIKDGAGNKLPVVSLSIPSGGPKYSYHG